MRAASTTWRTSATTCRGSGSALARKLDALDDDRLDRLVLAVRLRLLDRVDRFHAGGDAAEDGVLAVEPGRRLRGDDEELTAVRVRPSVRHREGAALDL